MAGAVVGALRVNLGLDSAQFGSGLKGAQSDLAKFGAIAAKGFAVVAAGAAAAAAAIAIGVRGVLNDADSMAKAAQKIGVPVEELSKLKHAAELSGVSFESLQSSMGRLAKAMSEAAVTPTSEAGRAFAALGISVKNADGSLRSTSETFTAIAGALSGFEDGAAKTALAMALMGRSGAEMIPLLNSGTEGLAAMKREAEDLGIVITEKTAKAAEGFNDNLDRIGKLFSGIYVQITAEIAPALETFTNALVAAGKEGAAFKHVGEIVGAALDWITEKAIFASGQIRGLSASFAGWGRVVDQVTSGQFGGAVAEFGRMRSELSAIEQQMTSSLARVRMAAGSRNIMAGAAAILPTDGFSGGAGASAAKPPAPVMTKAADEAGKAKSAIDEAARAARKFESEFERFQKNLRTPFETLQVELNKIEEYWEKGKLSVGEYGRAVDAAQLKFQEAIVRSSDVAQILQSSLNSMFDALLNGSFKAKDALADLAKSLAKMAMNKVFQQLLSSIFSHFGGGGAPLNLIGGVPKFATGTSFAPGGMAMVGERGPELVNLPRGSQVIPNARLGGGGGVQVQIVNNTPAKISTERSQGGDGRELVRFIVDEVKTGFARGDFDGAQRARFGALPRKILR